MAYKRSNNLGNHLIRNFKATGTTKKRENQIWTPKPGMYRCGRCTHCNGVLTGQKFSHAGSGREYLIKSRIDCQSDYQGYSKSVKSRRMIGE